MAGPYYVKASGSNTSPYDTWAKAATSLGTAVTLAGAGETIWVDSAFSESLGSNPAYAPAAGVRIISTSSGAEPPTTYNTGATISTTGSVAITLAGNGAWYGMLFKVGAGGGTGNMQICLATSTSVYAEDCTFQLVNTNSACRIIVGLTTAAPNRQVVYTRNCSFIFAATTQSYNAYCQWEDQGSNFDAGATHPTGLFSTNVLRATLLFDGGDFSGNSGTYFAAMSGQSMVYLTNCKLNASATISAAMTIDGQGEIFVRDCNSGDVQYNFAHYNYRGSTIISSSVYVTAGATFDGSTNYSLSITGNSNVSVGCPYFSPWIDQRSDADVGNSVTPRLEIARTSSATALKDNEVWGEFLAKSTSGVPRTTLTTDRLGLAATAADQATGTGTGNWTGSALWSGKLEPAALTVQEVGYMRARVVLAVATTVYLDPQIYGI